MRATVKKCENEYLRKMKEIVGVKYDSPMTFMFDIYDMLWRFSFVYKTFPLTK